MSSLRDRDLVRHEARIGQKNTITRCWAKRGTRPAAPSDQRTASTYIFGAVCSALGKGAAVILPRCNTLAMNLHLAENRPAVAPGYHIAGWHLSHHLAIPPNITLVLLPVKCQSSIRRKHLAIYARQLALQPRAIGSDRENLLGAGRGHTLVLTVATLSFRG